MERQEESKRNSFPHPQTTFFFNYYFFQLWFLFEMNLPICYYLLYACVCLSVNLSFFPFPVIMFASIDQSVARVKLSSSRFHKNKCQTQLKKGGRGRGGIIVGSLLEDCRVNFSLTGHYRFHPSEVTSRDPSSIAALLIPSLFFLWHQGVQE